MAQQEELLQPAVCSFEWINRLFKTQALIGYAQGEGFQYIPHLAGLIVLCIQWIDRCSELGKEAWKVFMPINVIAHGCLMIVSLPAIWLLQMTPRICFISEKLPQSSWDDKEPRCPCMARTSDGQPPGITGLPSDLPGDNGPMRTKETRWNTILWIPAGLPDLTSVGAPSCPSGYPTSAPLLPVPPVSARAHL